MDSGLEAEIAAARRFSDPDGEAPGGVDSTYSGGIGRGESEYARTWEDAPPPDDYADESPPPQSESQGWPVDALDDDGEIETVFIVEKRSENGTQTFIASDRTEYVQPRHAGSLYVQRSAVTAAYPHSTLRTAIELYAPPAAKRDRS